MRVRGARDRGRDRAGHAEARGRVAQHEGHSRAGARQGSPDLSSNSQSAQPWMVEGPVQVEVFALRMRSGRAELAGTCGPHPWYTELDAQDDPVEVVSRLSRNLMGEPMLVHSTSWRRARGAVVLSFVVVNSEDQAPHLAGIPISRAELARSQATSAAETIASAQVLEHGLRHLAWLANEDPVLITVLTEDCKRLLAP